ncbi:MAG TPA: HAD family hydrolase [Bacteroidales bacterium]|nr:HAD family hydrolase [Bacteroidales bacterium]
MILVFDAANTLIYKPSLFKSFVEVLAEHGYLVEINDLKYLHKIITELTEFPDLTTKEFYDDFNSKLLLTLGIIPNSKLLDSIFSKCTYLPWEKYEDTIAIKELQYQKVVLSNFNSSLNDIINKLFPGEFSEIIISEKAKCRKPDLDFYKLLIKQLSVKADEIIYIGDSVKLDLEPATKVGINAWMIDRDGYYPNCKKRLESLHDLKTILSKK